jgi:hypothetical protein
MSDAFDVYDRWRRTQSRDRGDRRAGRLALDEGGGEGAVDVVSYVGSMGGSGRSKYLVAKSAM